MQFEPLSDHINEIAEAPVWSAAHNALFYIDIFGPAIHELRWDTLGRRSWAMPCEPGSLAVDADGTLIVGLVTGIHRLDTATGALTKLATAPYDTSTTRFNDGRCDAEGRFWTGTMDRTKTGFTAGLSVFENGRLRPGPQGVMVSNGVAFSLDHRTLYQADSGRGVIYRYPFDLARGATGPRELFFTCPHGMGAPDGASVDAKGNYWLAMYEGGVILRISPRGDLLDTFALPVPDPTMVTFAGPDLDAIVVTTSRFRYSADRLRQLPDAGKVLVARSSGYLGLPEQLYRSSDAAVAC